MTAYPFPAASPAPPAATTADPTAVMGRRIVAIVIDFLIYLLIMAFFGPTPLSPLAEYYEVPDSVDNVCGDVRDADDDVFGCLQMGDRVYVTSGSDFAVQIVVWLAFVGAYAAMQGATGRTPGKALLGLKVVNEQGADPGFGRGLGRTLLWVVDAAPWCLPLVGFITGLTTKGHRRVGDMACKTFVVGKDHAGPVIVPGLTTAAVGPYGAPGAPGAPWGAPPGASGPPTWGAPAQPQAPWGAPPSGGFPPPGASVPPSASAPPTAPAGPHTVSRPSPPTGPPAGAPAATPSGPPSGAPVPGAPAPGSPASGPPPASRPAPPGGSSPSGPSGPPAATPSTGTPTPTDEGSRPAPTDEGSQPAPAAGRPRVPPVRRPVTTRRGAGAPPTPAGAPAAGQGATSGGPSDPATPGAQQPPATAAAPAASGPAPSGYNPQWDAARGTYIVWEPQRGQWLGWDEASRQWRPL